MEGKLGFSQKKGGGRSVLEWISKIFRLNPTFIPLNPELLASNINPIKPHLESSMRLPSWNSKDFPGIFFHELPAKRPQKRNSCEIHGISTWPIFLLEFLGAGMAFTGNEAVGDGESWGFCGIFPVFFHLRVASFRRPEHHWVLMESWEFYGFIRLSAGFVGMGRLGGAGSQSPSPKSQKFPGKTQNLGISSCQHRN